ncbi:MAG: hypothetical protein J5I93_03140 [Pirellulaceae bacterium]|nr:hypothetical protein [Pirellulaceae bacterium]
MTHENSPQPAPAELLAVQETVGGLRSDYAQLQGTLAAQFEQLEQFRGDLLWQAELLQGERQRLAEREQELSRQRQTIDRLLQRIEQSGEAVADATLAAPVVAVPPAEAWQEISQQLEAARREIAQLVASNEQLNATREQLARAHSKLAVAQARLAAQGAELTDSRAQLSNTLAELSDARAAWNEECVRRASVEGRLEQLQAASSELECRLRQALSEREAGRREQAADRVQDERLRELELERSALETELELVRGRAAELYETVLDQKRELEELRTLTGQDLKAVVAWCHRQMAAPPREPSGNGSNGHAAASSPVTAHVSPATAARTPERPAADPVLHSVMAQFARLQQDANHRRQGSR